MNDLTALALGLSFAFALWDLGRRKFDSQDALRDLRQQLSALSEQHTKDMERVETRVLNLNSKIETGRNLQRLPSFGSRTTKQQ